MKNHSHAFTAASLSVPHVYSAKSKAIVRQSNSSHWWQRFHDPELNQLITVALSDSPTMQVAESRIRRARASADEAVTLLWPSVDASGYLQRARFSKFGLIPPPFNGRTFNIADIALNFNYEFDFWGKNREFLAARVSEECAAEADLAQARLILSAAVANTYFELQGNLAKLRIAKETLLQREKLLAIIRDRAKHDIQSDIPVKSSLADVQAIKLSVSEYAQAEQLSRHQLAILLGKNPFNTEVLANNFSYQRYHITLPKNLPANLLARRPDIIASRLRTEAAAHQVNVAKARFFPNVNLNGLLSFQAVTSFGHLLSKDSQNNAIAGAFDLPIFDAGLRRANLSANYAEYDFAVNQYNATILRSLREVADQLTLMGSLSSQLRAQTESVNAINHNYKLTYSRYKHGIVDYVQVIEVKQSLLQQKATQIDLQVRHLQAVVGLLTALGGNSLTSKDSYG